MTNSVQIHQAELLNDKYYSEQELCSICRLEVTVVVEMIEYDIISPDTSNGNLYTHTQVNRAMKAWRLIRDLELNMPGVALAMQLLDEIEQKDKELNSLR